MAALPPNFLVNLLAWYGPDCFARGQRDGPPFAIFTTTSRRTITQAYDDVLTQRVRRSKLRCPLFVWAGGARPGRPGVPFPGLPAAFLGQVVALHAREFRLGYVSTHLRPNSNLVAPAALQPRVPAIALPAPPLALPAPIVVAAPALPAPVLLAAAPPAPPAPATAVVAPVAAARVADDDDDDEDDEDDEDTETDIESEEMSDRAEA